MKRREALKLLAGATTAAVSSTARPVLGYGQDLPTPVDLNKRPPVPTVGALQENAPEQLLAAEPEIAINHEGEATIAWTTVVPTQGATVYLGLPNHEVKLEFPIYSGGTPIVEDS